MFLSCKIELEYSVNERQAGVDFYFEMMRCLLAPLLYNHWRSRYLLTDIYQVEMNFGFEALSVITYAVNKHFQNKPVVFRGLLNWNGDKSARPDGKENNQSSKSANRMNPSPISSKVTRLYVLDFLPVWLINCDYWLQMAACQTHTDQTCRISGEEQLVQVWTERLRTWNGVGKIIETHIEGKVLTLKHCSKRSSQDPFTRDAASG